jgi:hypothetical protein
MGTIKDIWRGSGVSFRIGPGVIIAEPGNRLSRNKRWPNMTNIEPCIHGDLGDCLDCNVLRVIPQPGSYAIDGKDPELAIIPISAHKNKKAALTFAEDLVRAFNDREELLAIARVFDEYVNAHRYQLPEINENEGKTLYRWAEKAHTLVRAEASR